MGLSSSGRNVEVALSSVSEKLNKSDTVYQNAKNGNSYFVNPFKSRVEVKSSQNWICPADVTQIALFIVGGGEGVPSASGTAGGSGGYVEFRSQIDVVPKTSYPIIIGAGGTGGASSRYPGGDTSAFGVIAKGASYKASYWPSGGSGGGGGTATKGVAGGDGGSDGADGLSSGSGNAPPKGSARSTRDPFSGKLYAGGGGGRGLEESGKGGSGGGGDGGINGKNGAANTGGGGGAGGGNGGSGVIVIYF